MERVTEVAAALIWQGDRFLICQRPAHKARGLLWEFVGGKQEPGETLDRTLVRECREELDVTVSVGPVFCRVLHVYPDITIRLTLFNAALESGELRLLEHADAAWITPEEIDRYDFCPADEEILAMLRRLSPQTRHIRRRLFDAAEEGYRAFQSRLMPTVDPDRVLGVRMPVLRRLAADLQQEKTAFLQELPHGYYEEDNLHALFLMGEQDFEKAAAGVEAFLPHVNNWATCDGLNPAVFRKNRQKLLPRIRCWLESDHGYTRRFAVKQLMDHFLDEDFSPAYLQWVADVQSDEYYVNMVRAWYFATALAKQWEAAEPFLHGDRLDPWTRRAAVQKAVESRRLSETQKMHLRELKG